MPQNLGPMTSAIVFHRIISGKLFASLDNVLVVLVSNTHCQIMGQTKNGSMSVLDKTNYH